MLPNFSNGFLLWLKVIVVKAGCSDLDVSKRNAHDVRFEVAHLVCQDLVGVFLVSDKIVIEDLHFVFVGQMRGQVGEADRIDQLHVEGCECLDKQNTHRLSV